MSARQRKRLQEALSRSLAESDGDEPDSVLAQPKKAYDFSVLMQEDDDSSDSENDSSSDGDANVRRNDGQVSPTNAAAAAESLPAPDTNDTIVRKKVKSRDKRKLKTSARVEEDKLAAAVALDPESMHVLRPHTWLSFLQPSERQLNIDTEMSALVGGNRYFGADAAAGRREAPGKSRGGVLVRPEGGWLPTPTKVAGGFSMAKSRTLGEITEFDIEFSDEFLALDDQYQAVVHSMEPGLMQHFLQLHPHHLPAVMDVYQYLRTTRQPEAAAKMLRRAAYVLETCWHPKFRPWSMACAIAPTTAANRMFYQVLFHALLLAGRCGAPKAATEAAKLSLQCSSASAVLHGTVSAADFDPYRIMLCMDHYAIRSGDWKLLLHATGGSLGRQPLPIGLSDIPCVWMPNWCFSRAIALHSNPQGMPSNGVETHLFRESVVSADIDEAVCSDLSYSDYSALRMMIRACMTFPHSISPLLRALNLRESSVGFGDALQTAALAMAANQRLVVPASQCKWRTVVEDDIYRAAQEVKPSETIAKLVDIMLCRNITSFRNPSILSLLYAASVIAAALLRAASGLPLTLESHLEALLDSTIESREAAIAEAHTASMVFDALYSSLHTPTSSRVLRAREVITFYAEAVATDFTDDIATVAEDELRAMQHEVQPPMDAPQVSTGLRELDVASSNILALFFTSILPWYVLPHTV